MDLHGLFSIVPLIVFLPVFGLLVNIIFHRPVLESFLFSVALYSL